MFPEVVRPGTLSRALHMQLRIGSAIEILSLLQAGVDVDPSEFEVLAAAAELFRSDDGSTATVMSYAMLEASGEMVTAVRAALAPNTVHDLQSTLKELAETLERVARTRTIDHEASAEVVTKLRAIRHELAARATVSTDETLGQATA